MKTNTQMKHSAFLPTSDPRVTCHRVFRLTKHIYYPAGVSVTAEKPLIYDKVDTMGAGAGDLTYQTTALSTFRQAQVDTSSSSADSSCSALCPTSDSHCHTMQVSLEP